MRCADDGPQQTNGRRLSITAVLMALAVVGTSAGAQTVDYIGGLQSTSGQYVFDQATVSHVLSNGIVLSGARWRVSASLPVILQNSSAVTYIGGQPLPTGGPGGVLGNRESGERVPMRRRGGAGLAAFPVASAIDSAAAPEAPGPYELAVGDPFLSAGLDIVATGTHRVATQVFTKIPVADPASGIGTGEYDFGAGLSYALIASRAMLFVDGSYWKLGDLPDLPLNDIVSGGIGIGRALDTDGRWSLLGTFNASASVVENVEAPMAAGVGIGHILADGRSLNLSLSVGLSESSPDWSLAVGWRTALRR